MNFSRPVLMTSLAAVCFTAACAGSTTQADRGAGQAQTSAPSREALRQEAEDGIRQALNALNQDTFDEGAAVKALESCRGIVAGGLHIACLGGVTHMYGRTRGPVQSPDEALFVVGDDGAVAHVRTSTRATPKGPATARLQVTLSPDGMYQMVLVIETPQGAIRGHCSASDLEAFLRCPRVHAAADLGKLPKPLVVAPGTIHFAGRSFALHPSCVPHGASDIACTKAGRMEWRRFESRDKALPYLAGRRARAKRVMSELNEGQAPERAGGDAPSSAPVTQAETYACTLEDVKTDCMRHQFYDPIESKTLIVDTAAAEVRGQWLAVVCSFYEDQAPKGRYAALCAEVFDRD